MRESKQTRLGFEVLESKRLLTASMCTPCDAMLSSASAFVSSQQNVTTLARATNGEAANAHTTNGARETGFGTATELNLTEGTQAIEGNLSSRPVYVFYLNPSKASEVDLGVTGGETQLLLFDVSNGSTPDELLSSGPVSTTLASGEYLVYVYDFSASAGDYTLEIAVPEAEPELVFEEFAEIDYIGRAFDWNLNAVNAPEVWANGFTGEGTLVAVVDTGVDYTHPDLDDNIWVNPGEIAGDGIDNDQNGYVDDIHGWDFAYRDNNPSDIDGHGTHVAGTIAAERNGTGTTGVAYDATILPVKVLRNDGTGSHRDIASGIRYAVDVGADIINLSLGGGVTRTLERALQYARDNDVLVVAASGNDAAVRPGAPAIYSSVLTNTISVGAHDQQGNLAGFSNRVGETNAIQVDAPGSRIASTSPNDEYRYLSGTSMASPHVAGVAALAYSANRNLSASDVRTLITAGANQQVRRSDSIGGINAARTVARASQFDVYSTTKSDFGTSSHVAMASMRPTRIFVTSTPEIDLLLIAMDSARSSPSNLFDGSAVEKVEVSSFITKPERTAATDELFAVTEDRSSVSAATVLPSTAPTTDQDGDSADYDLLTTILS